MASWTTPALHATADDLAVTDWNGVANNTTFLYQRPYILAYNSVATSCTNNSITQVTLGGTTFAGYGFSISSNNIILPLTGIYFVTGQSFFVVGTGGIQTLLRQNGTTFAQTVQAASSSNGTAVANVSSLLSGTAGDTIGLYTLQTSGGTINTSTGAANTFIGIYFVGSQ